MGQEISSIVYDENLRDVTKPGLSKEQLSSLEHLFTDMCNGAKEMNITLFSNMMNLDEKMAMPVGFRLTCIDIRLCRYGWRW